MNGQIATAMGLIYLVATNVGFSQSSFRDTESGKLFDLSAADIHFGENQVQQLCLDRPIVSTMIEQNQALRNWLVEGFAGKKYGNRIYWTTANTPSGRSFNQKSNDIAYIAMAPDQESAMDAVVKILFELENVVDDVHILDVKASLGTIDRMVFAKEHARDEFKAMIETRAVIKSLALDKDIVSQDQYAFMVMNAPDDFEVFLQSYPETQSDQLLTYWGHQFDLIASTALLRKIVEKRRAGEFQEALFLALAHLRENRYNLSFQMEAAMVLTEWSGNSDATIVKKALFGCDQNAQGKNVIWGWAAIEKVASKSERFRYESQVAKLNIAKCRMALGNLETDNRVKESHFRKAQSVINSAIENADTLAESDLVDSYHDLAEQLRQRLELTEEIVDVK